MAGNDLATLDRAPMEMERTRETLPQRQQRYSLSEMAKIAELLAASKFYADCTHQAQAFAKILRGAELGIEPATALAEVQIVQGKPVLSSNLIAALIKRSGRYAYRIRKHDRTVCEIEFFEHGDSLGVSKFTMDDAKLAKLDGKTIWQQYPENMLFARAISNGGRRYCGDILVGVYTEGELEPDYPKPVPAKTFIEEAQPLIEHPTAGPVNSVTGEIVKPKNDSQRPQANAQKASLIEEVRGLIQDATDLGLRWTAVERSGIKALVEECRAQGCKPREVLLDQLSVEKLTWMREELLDLIPDLAAAAEAEAVLEADMDEAMANDEEAV